LGIATCVGEWHPFCFFLPDSSLLMRPRAGVLVLVEGAGLLLGQPCGVLLLLSCPAAACQAAEELTSPGPGVSESDTSPELLRECCLPGLTLPPMNRRWCRSLESAVADEARLVSCNQSGLARRELHFKCRLHSSMAVLQTSYYACGCFRFVPHLCPSTAASAGKERCLPESYAWLSLVCYLPAPCCP
jgi:hypothetical protein